MAPGAMGRSDSTCIYKKLSATHPVGDNPPIEKLEQDVVPDDDIETIQSSVDSSTDFGTGFGFRGPSEQTALGVPFHMVAAQFTQSLYFSLFTRSNDNSHRARN